jgi:hypothetical protein
MSIALSNPDAIRKLSEKHGSESAVASGAVSELPPMVTAEVAG